MNKWIVYPKKTDNIIDQLLINRSIRDKDSFLNPNYDTDILDPFLFSDMQKAVERIFKAKEKKEKIGIFADYDADGIPGAAILTKLFSSIGIDSSVYIPSREEGYGLNSTGIKKLSAEGCKLLVTVDLGITGKKEVDEAKKNGMDVIITDHHEIQTSVFPENAFAIIHPNLPNQDYPNKCLSGGGVAWKLSQALISKLPDANNLQKTLPKWLMDLAAISTICDIVPLVGENRVIAKYGLKVLNKTKNLGLRKLYDISNIKFGSINTYNVGFQIGPRINAPGRMDHASASFYLLTTEDTKDAIKIAGQLNSINEDRQNELKRVLAEAKEKILEKNWMVKKS